MPKTGRQLLVLFCTGVLLTGCSKWVSQESAPEALMREQSPQLVRVTLNSGDIMEVARPEVTHDSLLGVLPNSSVAGSPLVHYSVSLDSVRSMAVKERSFGRTVSLVLVTPALVVGSVFLMGF
jgi:hypothetical protein